ncbi:MAG: ROK family transcriptional regulator [Rubellimicrobium sp.]|nr:ROK family transcriptional regulator [Rubellimicrobium sp.]
MGLRGTNQGLSRYHNRRIVLGYIREHGPAARGDIARDVRLTVQTVSSIVRELEESGYLRLRREQPRGRGAPAQMLHLNPDAAHAIGIGVSPLGVSAALVNLAGDITAHASRPLAGPDPEDGFRLIGELVATMRARCPEARILGAGMAIPGPLDVEGMSFVGPATLAGWNGIPLRERLAALTGLPAFIEIDTAAAAVGQHLHGEGRGLDQFYYLHLGAGLGGAMVRRGQPMRGAFGNAGEIGHVPVVPDGRPCTCGNRGCLECYVSLDAFRHRPAGQDEAGWAAAVAPMFHRALTIIENLFDPESIILGGLASPALLGALVATTGALPPSVSARRNRRLPRVIAASDTHSVLRGAAARALAEVLSPTADRDYDYPDDPLCDGQAA